MIRLERSTEAYVDRPGRKWQMSWLRTLRIFMLPTIEELEKMHSVADARRSDPSSRAFQQGNKTVRRAF